MVTKICLINQRKSTNSGDLNTATLMFLLQ